MSRSTTLPGPRSRRPLWRRELAGTLELAVPVALAELGWMLMSVVDTTVLGRVSTEALGAGSVGGVYFFAIAVFGEGLLFGLDTVVSQAFGAGRMADCHRALVQACYL